MRWLSIALMALAAATGGMMFFGSRLPLSHSASKSARFSAPPEKVWAALDDVQAMPSWRSDLKSVDLLPASDGRRRHREVWSNGRSIEMERVESAPYTRMASRIVNRDLPFQGGWVYELTPDGGGTMLKITENGEIPSALARFVMYYLVGYTATIEKYLGDLGKKVGV